MIAACVCVGASAQDTVPDTPPELKDFRLDTPPPKDKAPAPTPQPAPQPEPETKQPAPTRSSTRTTQPSTRQAEPDARPSTQPEVTAPTVEEPAATTETPPAVEPTAEPVAEPIPATDSASSQSLLRFWPLLLALLALAGGWFGWTRWKNRQAVARDPIVIPSKPEFAPVPQPVAPTPPAPVAETRGVLTASFEPAEARLSVANLMVTGCLRMRYEGAAPLSALRLRNMVISACEGQKAMMDSFHSDPESGQIDILGGIRPGEEIVLTLELQVPRDSLQAFDWRERRFVAPILLLNIGSDEGSITPCRINCLVGQEGDAQSPKMQPLPIDRGPKYFASLRFQAIAA